MLNQWKKIYIMAKELFNGTLATVLDRAKRFCFGAPSQDGSDNITIANAVDEIRGYLKLGDITSSYTTGTTLVDCKIVSVDIKVISGTPTFKIGSSSGGAELMNETEALTGNSSFNIFAPCYSATIYPRITGAGTLKVTLTIGRNIF